MINAIIGIFDDRIEPRQFLGEFYVYYSDRPAKHITAAGRLTHRELYFMSDAIRHNRTIETYSGIIYQCVNTRTQFDPEERKREYYVRRFSGYHHKKKRLNHGKKKAATLTR